MQVDNKNHPSLPRIRGDLDITIDIFTHRSLRAIQPVVGTRTVEEYGDPDRLAILGSNVYRLVVTDMVLDMVPKIKADEANVSLRDWLCENVN